MFDLGGVIMDIERDRAVRALQAIGMAEADEMLGVYGQKGAFLALEKGLISPAEFRDELRRSISRPVTDHEIDEAFMRFLIGIPVERLRWLDRLSEDGYHIYMLSNTNAIMWDGFIVDQFKKDGKSIGQYFEGIVTSFDVKAYKPDAAIFSRAAEICGILPSETLFFDDSETNCEAARRCGYHAVHVNDPSKPFADYIEAI